MAHSESCGCSNCGGSEVAAVQSESCGCSSSGSVTVHEHQHTEVAKPSVEKVPEIYESVTPQPALEPEEQLADPKPIPAQETFAEPVANDDAEDDIVNNTLVEPETTPAAEPAQIEPATDPQPAEAEDSGDEFGSIFDEPEAASAEESEPIVEENETAEEPEENLFDDMFDEPAEPTETEEPDSSSTESAEEPAEESAPEEAEEPAESDDSEDDFDDLFGSDSIPAKLRIAGGLHSTQTRHWTDNTARYHCEARLVSLDTDAIVIEKANGSMKRVPLRRLSKSDVQFVRGQDVAQQEMLAKQGNSKKLVSQLAK